MQKERDIYKRSRTLYVFDAALEYFVAIITAGAYLAKLTEMLDMPDGLTGILSAFVSLGGTLSLLSVFITKRKPVRHKVCILQSVCHLSFALIFLVPFFDIKNNIRILIFCAFFFVAYSLYFVIYTVQSDWFMGLVEPNKRGRFAAALNNFALGSGMIFSLIIGSIIDYYTNNGAAEKFLILSFIILTAIAIGRTLLIFFSREKISDDEAKKNGDGLLSHAKALTKNRRFVHLLIVFCLWSAALYATNPFFGTYQNKELGFSMLFVSILGILNSFARIGGTFFFGKIADHRSFNVVLNLGFIILSAALLLNTFTVPSNGKIFFTIYYLMYAVALGAMSICQVNSIIEVVEPNQRSAAIAIKYSLTGLAGFLTTLAVSPLVSLIQNNGNRFFGMNVYAQQIVSLIGVLIGTLAIVYFNVFARKRKNAKD